MTRIVKLVYVRASTFRIMQNYISYIILYRRSQLLVFGKFLEELSKEKKLFWVFEGGTGKSRNWKFQKAKIDRDISDLT